MGNANSGRRPQPTAMRVLRGNPGKRPISATEPQFGAVDEAFDEPPVELAGDVLAEKEWRRLAPMLRVARVVSEGDRTALVALCQKWSQYLDAHGKVRSLGMIVKKPNGVPVVNPYLAASDHALSTCRALWVELGLTPSARAKLSALPEAEPGKASKWAGLL